MKVRRFREQAMEFRDGTPSRTVCVLEEAEAPDGVLNLDLDATLLPDGTNDTAPIVVIDYDEGWYRREGRRRQPIPDAVWYAEDLEWRMVRVMP